MPAQLCRLPEPNTTKTIALRIWITAARKKTFCHSERVELWYVKAPATWGPTIDATVATNFVSPMILPAWRGARSSWLTCRTSNVIHVQKTNKNMSATATARLQPMYPTRISIQAARSNPVAQKIFLTTFVDSLPGDRSQSANQPSGMVKRLAKNGTAENAPLFVILNPRTSHINTGTQVISVLKPQL